MDTALKQHFKRAAAETGRSWASQFGLLSSSQRALLPDEAFAYIEPGGSKDSEGRTTPDSLRHFPIVDANHVRDALARIAQGAQFGKEAMPKVEEAAKKFGIDPDNDGDDDSSKSGDTDKDAKGNK